MPVILYRVDERLIHGQVVVGWGASLHPERFVVVDDELAASDWEQELYTLGLPEGMESIFVPVEEARDRLTEWQRSDDRTIVLTRNVGSMLALARDGGLADAEVNVGGIHYAPGRDRVLPYVFLSERERAALRALVEGGVKVAAQDVPSARRVEGRRLLGDDA